MPIQVGFVKRHHPVSIATWLLTGFTKRSVLVCVLSNSDKIKHERILFSGNICIKENSNDSVGTSHWEAIVVSVADKLGIQ
jgi:hypothetical protein